MGLEALAPRTRTGGAVVAVLSQAPLQLHARPPGALLRGQGGEGLPGACKETEEPWGQPTLPPRAVGEAGVAAPAPWPGTLLSQRPHCPPAAQPRLPPRRRGEVPGTDQTSAEAPGVVRGPGSRGQS